MKMTLHGVDRQVDDGADLRRVEILLIAKRDDEALHLRQAGDELAHLAIEQRIARLAAACEIDVVEAHRARPWLPQLIDTPPRCHSAQPKDEVRPRLDRPQTPEHLQKNLLRKLLGTPPIVEEVQRDAEDHR